MSAPPTSAGRGPFRYKMKQLVEATGLPRQAIHFYIQEGLLPPGRKTGRNMAWYSDEHLRRLGIIQKLQQERFLPLKAIKAVLDGGESQYTPEQRAFLGEVRMRMDERYVPKSGPAEHVALDTLIERFSLDRGDCERAIELGMVGAKKDADGRLLVRASDAWFFELVGEIRRAGFTSELGFPMDAMVLYEEAMQRLVDQEVRLVSERLSGLPPDVAASMVERVMPLVHTMLTRYHDTKVRDFFGTLL